MQWLSNYKVRNQREETLMKKMIGMQATVWLLELVMLSDLEECVT